MFLTVDEYHYMQQIMPNNKNKNLLKLKNNMLFQLSLTSKELYHSNFLYWIGTNGNMKEYFRRVVLDLSDGKVDLAKTGYTVYPKSVIRISLCRTILRNPNDRFGLIDLLSAHRDAAILVDVDAWFQYIFYRTILFFTNNTMTWLTSRFYSSMQASRIAETYRMKDC